MANILEKVKLSDPVSSAATLRAGRHLAPIEDARDAVIDFLRKLPDARHVHVTKLAPLDSEKGTWEAEAEVQRPNATLKMLGLPLQREVLSREVYLLRLDGELHVVAYGFKDSVGQ